MSSEKISYDAPSWEYMESLTVELYIQFKDEFFPDIIAGISRGGLIPSRLISDLFLIENKKPTLSVMQIGFYSGVGTTHKEPIVYQDLPGLIYGKKVLLIDDVADSGVSLEYALQYLNMKKPEEVKIGTLYYKPWSKVKPHYYVEETSSWIIFPHERYEFMTDRIKNMKMNQEEAKQFFLEEAGIPQYSIDNFFKLHTKK
jgi:hypothetical protein